MLSTIKERIPFLKSKTLDEYNQTVLIPSFNMIDISSNANYVGLDISTYQKVMKRDKNLNSLDINYRIMKLINYINKIIFDDDLVQQIVKKIIFVAYYGDFECQNKSFKGFIDIDNNKYKFAVEIDTKSITYGYEYNNQKQRGSFTVEKDGIKINNNFIDKKVITINKICHYNIKNCTDLEVYDLDRKQQFGYKIMQKYNYYTKEGSEEKIVNKINTDENYTEKNYIWKCPNNTVIKKKEIKYHYPDNNENNLNNIEECLIGKNISPNSYKLPIKGVFYHIDHKLFQDYYFNRCDINTLWDNAYIYQRVS